MYANFQMRIRAYLVFNKQLETYDLLCCTKRVGLSPECLQERRDLGSRHDWMPANKYSRYLNTGRPMTRNI